MRLGEKIKEIRTRENLTRKEFAAEIGIPFDTLGNYEYSKRDNVSGKVLQNITNHPRFRKYTLWLMTDDDFEDYAEEQVLSQGEFNALMNTLDEQQLEQVFQYMRFIARDGANKDQKD